MRLLQNSFEILQNIDLFNGFSEEEIRESIHCLKGYTKKYQKRGIIFSKEAPLPTFGIVLTGTIFLSSEDITGSTFIFTELSAGDIVGETALQFTQTGVEYDVTAATDCEILFFHKENIVQPNKVICALRARIIENLFTLLLQKNQELYHKLDIVSHKNLRNKILHYLHLQSQKSDTQHFTIPFSREELANYLIVDRSALSRELSRMQDDGLITFSRNTFQLL
ncbi:Crp/Fnr family transcriptional regulator [Niallia taxi]|nr:Crp/Fnr family transcriptional regulator [Niallia taxi]MDE5052410.1 Crp/Fnr family transcriptional regulator [Niallia taxi]